MGHHRRRPQSAVPLRSGPVLGCPRQRGGAAPAAGAERPRRSGVDRPDQGTLRHPRHARAADHRPRAKPRLRASHQLGRGAPFRDGRWFDRRVVPGLMGFADRLLTIVVTATLTSAVWIVVGTTYVDRIGEPRSTPT